MGSGGQEHCPDRIAEGLATSGGGFPFSLLSVCGGGVGRGILELVLLKLRSCLLTRSCSPLKLEIVERAQIP